MADLRKLKKAELQLIANHLDIPGTDGVLRSELETKVSEFLAEQGGLQKVAQDGLLTDDKVIALLNAEEFIVDDEEEEAEEEEVVEEVVASPKRRKSGIKQAPLKVREESTKHGHGFFDFISFHQPFNNAWAHLHRGLAGRSSWMMALRRHFSTPESLVLLLVYVEIAVFIWNTIVWTSTPAFALPVPKMVGDTLKPFLKGYMKKNAADYSLFFFAPIFKNFWDVHRFIYPAITWLVLFVMIPSFLGTIVNFRAAVPKGVDAFHVCPVSMLTFSLSRLLILYLHLTSGDINMLFGTAPLETVCSSVTHLFDGYHVPIKLFLTTNLVGIVYSFYERK